MSRNGHDHGNERDNIQSPVSRRGGVPDIDFEAGHDPERVRKLGRMLLQRHAKKQSTTEARQAPGSENATTQVDRAASDAGAPLPEPLREKFESSLGADLSSVRVHTGGASQAAAESVGAKAYTTGQDIHFGAGQYDPSSKEGQYLLAHEVAHTVQQGNASNAQPQAKLEVSNPGDAHENEADRAADAMMAGTPVSVARGSVASVIARSPKGGMLSLDRSNQPLVYEEPSANKRPFELGLPPTSEQIPAPFDMPVPIGQNCVSPPRARDWSAIPAIAVSPSERLNGEPGFKPEYADDSLNVYKEAFRASWHEAQHGYNALVTLHLKLAPLLQADPHQGLAGKKHNATDAFDGSRLKPNVSKIDPSKVDSSLADQIQAARDKVNASERAVSSKMEGIETANSRLHQTTLDVENAMSDIDIVGLDGDIANLQLDKDAVRRDLDLYRAKVKVAVESAKAAFSIVNILTDLSPAKIGANVVGALNQAANAGGAAAEAHYVSDANQKLDALDQQIKLAQRQKTDFLHKKAENTLAKNLEEMRIKGRELNAAIRDLKTARDSHAAAYREMATLMRSAGIASGMNMRDASSLAAAVEAVPKMKLIVEQVESMDQNLTVPTYDESSGIGAAMSTSFDAFAHALGVLKGNKTYIREQKAIWEGRIASVQAAIDRALFVPGTEF